MRKKNNEVLYEYTNTDLMVELKEIKENHIQSMTTLNKNIYDIKLELGGQKGQIAWHNKMFAIISGIGITAIGLLVEHITKK